MKTVKEMAEALAIFFEKFASPETQAQTVKFAVADGETVLLAEGVETEIEVARSGSFVDMNKQKVDVTPDLMKTLAASLDLEEHEPKLKLGHEPIKTDTPNFGSVVGLMYDDAKDRLMAKIRPTQALIRRVRDGSFNQRSMEFSMDGKGGAKFLHLGFLGARKPAIGGLAPISLAAVLPGDGSGAFYTLTYSVAAPEAEAVELAAAAGKCPDCVHQAAQHASDGCMAKMAGGGPCSCETPGTAPGSKNATKGMADPEKSLDSPDRTISEGNKMTSEAKLKRFETQAKNMAENLVDSFFAKYQSRIPLNVTKLAKLGLVDLMVAESEVEQPATINLAADGAETKLVTPSAFVMALLSALPEQVTPAEKKEVAKDDPDPIPEEQNTREFAGCEPTSIALHLAAKAEIAEAKAKGEEIVYLEALRRVEIKGQK